MRVDHEVRKVSAGHSILLDSVVRFRQAGVQLPKKVQAHPERRTANTDGWSKEDWGIFLADLVAGSAGTLLTVHGKQFKVLDVPV